MVSSIRAVGAALALIAVSVFGLTACSNGSVGGDGPVTLHFRTWDTDTAAAYKTSFAAFTRAHPSITVQIDIEPWSDYFNDLNADIAGGEAPDVFWLNNASYRELASNDYLMNVDDVVGRNARVQWSDEVVRQFTLGGTLWGVPQTGDGGIALYYNKTLATAAHVTSAEMGNLSWATSGQLPSLDPKNSPGAGVDNLVSIAQRLTKDSKGVSAGQPGFDPTKIVQYGYNAGQDLQAIYLPFIGSNGGTYLDGRTFTFTNPKTVSAFQYVVDLVNKYYVAPPANLTNNDGNYSRDQFLQGKMAMFQSGLYSLPAVKRGANFDWDVVKLPTGPAGSVSVSNGISAAGSAASKHPEETKTLLRWLASRASQDALAKGGVTFPAMTSAQGAYYSYWSAQQVDISPFFYTTKENSNLAAPGGANFNEAFATAKVSLDKIFLGTLPVDQGLKQAEVAANAVMRAPE